MYDKPTAPRSIGGVLDDGLRLWRNAFSKTWPVAIMGQLLVGIPLLFFWLRLGSGAKPQGQFALMMASPLYSIVYGIVSILSLGFHNAVIAQTNAGVTHAPMSIGESVALGFRLIGRTFLVGFLMGFGLLIPLGLLFFALSGVSMLGRALFAVAAFLAASFVFGRLILGTIILVIEDRAAVDSLRKSWNLTAGHWWRVATIITVLIVMIFVVFLVVGVVAGVVAGLRGPASGVSSALVQILTILGNALIAPLYAAVSVAIYYDLMLRKEGGDLASRVSTLAPR